MTTFNIVYTDHWESYVFPWDFYSFWGIAKQVLSAYGLSRGSSELSTLSSPAASEPETVTGRCARINDSSSGYNSLMEWIWTEASPPLTFTNFIIITHNQFQNPSQKPEWSSLSGVFHKNDIINTYFILEINLVQISTLPSINNPDTRAHGT